MDDVNVLVVFYSRTGLTERLAVLLAEGAIQAGAKIRLRRSRDLMPEEVIVADEAWRSERDRMEKEFAAPRLEDVAWADVIALGTPATTGGVSVELGATLAQIGTLDRGSLTRKAATAFTSSYGAISGAELALSELQSRLLRLGFVTLPVPEETDIVGSETSRKDYERARVHGRKLTALGRALRAVES
ncbi:MAG: NAD(P)H-dependent oxidoreductase [Acidobacteriaceae bacterium]|nr:NAD(P)H-dependent oxidoreductase [Acidobacteriaceae bacterium]